MSKIFISYRRKGGNILGQLLYYRLKEDSHEVFFDTESMKAGRFDEQIIEHIDASDVFLLLLTPNALDRCVEEGDFVRREITHALQNRKKIVSVMTTDFDFPEVLPDDIQEIRYYQGVPVNLEFAEAFYQKVLKYINEIDLSEAEPEEDFYDQIIKSMNKQFPDKDTHEGKKEERDEEIKEATPQQKEEACSEDEDWPEDDEIHRCYSVLDSPGTTTLSFQVVPWDDKETGMTYNYLVMLSPREEEARTGIRRTFFPIFSNGRTKDTRVELSFLTIMDKEHEAFLNAGDFRNGILRVGKHPGRSKYSKNRPNLPENWMLDSLVEKNNDVFESKAKDLISSYSPKKLEYVIVDLDTKQVIRPQMIRVNGEIKLKLSILPDHSYFVLNCH